MDTKTREYWAAHIKASEQFEGSQSEYCEKHGIKVGSLSARKSQLQNATRSSKRSSSSFCRVQLSNSQKTTLPRLPDPVWLARFLKAWGSDA